MRKLIVQQWISADGFATDSDGTTAFFEFPDYNQGWESDQLKLMESIDAILLGVNTYRMFLDYWPDADPDKEAIAPMLNSTPKFVFSSTMVNAPWGRWNPATVVNTDAVQYVQNLKQQEGKDIILWGSLTLCKTLVEAGLADEFHLTVSPAFVGTGKHFLPDSTEWLDMKLLKSKTYETGVLSLVYKP
ncbi:reductase [Flavobacterium sp. Sd200]|uniref:dihydrofolate reductase family protein n=1 Tax=Flavobacterium sp. Sd200 TaxID=2692211 RepID=UPI001367F78C|nr:dihydrofolate reductase family protein [Flavobacterium sp. Sd200]MXN90863.1 reductase [Flavobacterium sp. Sd200]